VQNQNHQLKRFLGGISGKELRLDLPFSVIADATASSISPEFPMQVVHP
jgi:hypothetical protein